MVISVIDDIIVLAIHDSCLILVIQSIPACFGRWISEDCARTRNFGTPGHLLRSFSDQVAMVTIVSMPVSEDADGDIEYGVATTVTKSQLR